LNRLKLVDYELTTPHWFPRRFIYNYPHVNFVLESFSKLLQEQCVKVNLSRFPGKCFGILGVDSKSGLIDAYAKEGKHFKQPYKVVESGWLVYNPYRIVIGSIGVKKPIHRHRYVSPAYVVFSCTEAILPEFLLLLFKTQPFLKQITNYASGSVRQSLSFRQLSQISVPLPPLSTQQQLVTQYYQACENAELNLKQLRVLEKEIEKSLLNQLGIGPIPRFEGAGKIPTLTGIEFSQLSNWNVSQHCSISASSFLKKSCFTVVKFGDIIDFLQYGISEKMEPHIGGMPALRMVNIQEGYLDLNNLKYLREVPKGFKHQLKYGDLLFNRTNSKKLVGKTAVFQESGAFTFASYLIRIRVNQKKADVNYINSLFNSSLMRPQIDWVSRQNLGQANINSSELKNFLLPLPPLEKQARIVSSIRKIKKRMMELKTQSENVRQDAITEFERALFS